MFEALENLLPDRTQLHFSKTVTHATMDAEPKGQMMSRCITIDNEFVWSFNNFIIPVTRHP